MIQLINNLHIFAESNQNKMMNAYTLKKKKLSEEYHLFEGKMTEEGCTSKQLSICGKMDRSESSGNIFSCEEEDSARRKCAKIGRNVCSICVSYFYTTY
jgi:hypothetical protein